MHREIFLLTFTFFPLTQPTGSCFRHACNIETASDCLFYFVSVAVNALFFCSCSLLSYFYPQIHRSIIGRSIPGRYQRVQPRRKTSFMVTIFLSFFQIQIPPSLLSFLVPIFWSLFLFLKYASFAALFRSLVFILPVRGSWFLYPFGLFYPDTEI